jgi:vacuolar protein sorting-associated protein IST1
MKEAVTTVIYATPRVEIPEFLEVRKQFSLKFGAQFVEKAMVNHDLTVNDKVMFKLGVKVPEPYLCVQYLKQIAEENNIEWADSSEVPISGNTGMPPHGGNSGGYGGLDQFQALPPSNYGPPLQSQQFHQTGAVSTQYGSGNTGGYGSSNTGYQIPPQVSPQGYGAPPPTQYGSNQQYGGVYPPSGGHQSPPQYGGYENTPPPYIAPTNTTSGYTVDFQPNVQHPLEHTLPTFTTPSDNYDNYASTDGGDEYNFDELQKRFEALKKRE